MFRITRPLVSLPYHSKTALIFPKQLRAQTTLATRSKTNDILFPFQRITQRERVTGHSPAVRPLLARRFRLQSTPTSCQAPLNIKLLSPPHVGQASDPPRTRPRHNANRSQRSHIRGYFVVYLLLRALRTAFADPVEQLRTAETHKKSARGTCNASAAFVLYGCQRRGSELSQVAWAA